VILATRKRREEFPSVPSVLGQQPVVVFHSSICRRCGELVRAIRISCSGIVVILAAVLFPRASEAIGPHEVAIIINEASRDSETVGDAYTRLRSIPASNVVRLRLPAALTKGQEMSREEFTRYVWNPAREQLLLQGVSDHILTWVFSCDFPVRVTSVPAVSLTGLVFARNHLPESLQIEKGLHLSPLFAGPHNERSAGFMSQSLDVSQRWVPPGDMPLPAMMLGYTRERGTPWRRSFGAWSEALAPTTPCRQGPSIW
jgi:hypothetical protein